MYIIYLFFPFFLLGKKIVVTKPQAKKRATKKPKYVSSDDESDF